MPPLRSLLNCSLLLITCLQVCCAAPFINFNELSLPALPELPSLTGALERMTNYGYSMLGYDNNHVEHEYDIVPDKQTLWDGHIGVPDFLTPLLGSIQESTGGRVVQGHDGRVGFRAAIPYFGDIQYIREIGPGRFTDKLGPGKYEYPGLSQRPQKEDDHSHSYTPYSPPAPTYTVSHKKKPKQPKYPKKLYQGLQNYPWNV